MNAPAFAAGDTTALKGTIAAPSGTDRQLTLAIGIQWLTAIATLVLVLAPLGPILWQSLLDRPLYQPNAILSLDNFARLLNDAGFLRAVATSFELAFAATAIACVTGVGLALFLERTDLSARGAFRLFALAPMYMSQLVNAFAWYLIYGPAGYLTLFGEKIVGVPPWDMYGIGGMAIVAGTSMTPLVYLFCSSSARMADATLEDAARCVGAGPLKVLWSVSLPLMRPSIIYAALLVFIGTLETLAVPLVFGRPVGLESFTTFLFSRGLGAITPDYGMVGAAAVLLLVLVAVLLVIQSVLLKGAGRFVTVRGKAQRPRRIALGALRRPIAAVFWGYFALTLMLPLVAITLRSFTTFLTPLLSPLKVLTADNYALVLGHPAYLRSITNSVIVASVGALVATLGIAVIALVAKRSAFRFARELEYVAMFPRAMPGIVAGIGFFWAMLLLPFAYWLQGTIWILMIAFAMRGIPTAYGAIAAALVQVGTELDQSARSVGAGWWKTCTAIVLPLIRPALFSAFTLLFLSFLKEYASAVFLYAPGSEIIGTTMLSLWSNGDTGAVAALSVIQIAITAFFVSLAHFVTRTKRDV